MESCLALDIGNTHTDVAVFVGGELQKRHRWATTRHLLGEDAYDQLMREQPGADPAAMTVVLSSVLPSLVAPYRAVLPRLHVVSHETDLGFAMAVPAPEQVGTDRLAACAAAVARLGAPVIVIDSGTAATLSVIDADGRFIGGGIMPGLTSGLQGLLAAAPRLPAPDLRPPFQGGLGETTLDAIRCGTLRGHAGALDGLIAAGMEAVGPAPVIGTGGSLPLVASWLKGLTVYEPDLVLWGLYAIGQREAQGG